MNQINISPNYLFNLLAGGEYEYPLLQKDAVEKITKNITDIVYTTVKQKSTASSVKRCNLLHLLNITCETPDFHILENSSQFYLNPYEQDVCNLSKPHSELLLSLIIKEQQVLNARDIHAEVLQFYKRKTTKRKKFVKKIELIKQKDVEELQKVNFNLIKMTVSSYETDQTLIDKLLKVAHGAPIEVSHVVSLEVRKKQVGFLYSIVNIYNDYTRSKIVNYILDQIQSYETLEKCEIKLLEDLWMNEEYTRLIVQKFPFIMERIILGFCHKIVTLAPGFEASEYFLSLTDNLTIHKLQKVCAVDSVLYNKLKSLIFELYVHSFCNENVHKFVNYIS